MFTLLLALAAILVAIITVTGNCYSDEADGETTVGRDGGW